MDNFFLLKGLKLFYSAEGASSTYETECHDCNMSMVRTVGDS